jgi:hypothetical protein
MGQGGRRLLSPFQRLSARNAEIHEEQPWLLGSRGARIPWARSSDRRPRSLFSPLIWGLHLGKLSAQLWCPSPLCCRSCVLVRRSKRPMLPCRPQRNPIGGSSWSDLMRSWSRIQLLSQDNRSRTHRASRGRSYSPPTQPRQPLRYRFWTQGARRSLVPTWPARPSKAKAQSKLNSW